MGTVIFLLSVFSVIWGAAFIGSYVGFRHFKKKLKIKKGYKEEKHEPNVFDELKNPEELDNSQYGDSKVLLAKDLLINTECSLSEISTESDLPLDVVHSLYLQMDDKGKRKEE